MSVPIAPGLSVPLESEIERLRKEWVRLYGVERMRFAAVKRLDHEVDQLRAANYELRKMASIFSELFVHAEEECERLEALNAEMLAALRYIVAYFRGGIMPTDLREWMRRADDAIAKAEGRP